MKSTKELKIQIKNHKRIVSVYGLGNVGGPLAAAWLNAGAKVIGVDISNDLLNQIKSGKSHQKEPYISDIFKKHLKKGNFSLTGDGINASKNSDIKLIAVPVAFKGKKIDFNALLKVSKNIASGLKKNDLVIICPSLPPNSSEKVVLPILEKQSGLKGENDFYLVYNPERIFEGRALQDIEENYPAIVGGLGKKSLEYGSKLLKIISKKGVLTLNSIATAEAEKLFEGVYRDVNIALANQLADYCEMAGINFWEARLGANSQPFCNLHYPGTGVGGICIPIYPRFVLEDSKKYGKSQKLIEFARKTNDKMPKKCVHDAFQLLDKKTLSKKPKIAILGLGFRGDVTDSRLSPTYEVVKEFLKKKCHVSVHDPFITQDSILPSTVNLSKDLKTIIKNADLIFISTDHKIYSKLNKQSFSNTKKPLLIFDGRNILNQNNFKNTSLTTIGIR